MNEKMWARLQELLKDDSDLLSVIEGIADNGTTTDNTENADTKMFETIADVIEGNVDGLGDSTPDAPNVDPTVYVKADDLEDLVLTTLTRHADTLASLILPTIIKKTVNNAVAEVPPDTLDGIMELLNEELTVKGDL